MGRWLILLLAFCAAPKLALATNLDALLHSIVATYGGPKAVAGMESYRVEAQVSASIRGRTASVRRDFQAPDRLRVSITYPDSVELRILDGAKGWRGEPERLQRVDGLPRLAMVYQLLRSTVPWCLVRHQGLLEDRGTLLRGGRRYRVLGLPWDRQLDMFFWVDAVTRRVVRVEGLLRARGAQTTFATEYGDFRRVQGLLVPWAEENHASGRNIGTTRVVDVAFDPPDLGPFQPSRAER